MGGADARHVLPHRADVIVFVGVVMEVVVMEQAGVVARALFEVETVVFDVSLHSGFIHEAVVLFGAIARVGDGDRGQMPVLVKEGVEKRYQRECVGRIGEQGEVGDELIFGRDLQVVSGVGLTVVHRVLLHTHESRPGRSSTWSCAHRSVQAGCHIQRACRGTSKVPLPASFSHATVSPFPCLHVEILCQ